ncbi:MAG: autotransporter-associated beta strand repeat-containing protein [Luteolibacter sp.]
MKSHKSVSSSFHISASRFFFIIANAALLTAPSASAVVWDGSSNGNWGNGANWATATVPGAGNLIEFNNLSLGSPSIYISAARNVAGISFLSGNPIAQNIKLSTQPNATGTAVNLTFTASNTGIIVNDGLNHIVGTFGAGTNGDIVLLGNLPVATTSGNLTINRPITDGASSFGVTKTGSGTLTLDSNNTYDGTTTVTSGTLAISSTGTINNSTGVTLNGGTLRYNSSTNLAPAVTFTSGTIAGTNWNGTLAGQTIGTGQTIAPGNSPGTATTGAQTWANGGSYVWEINDATGTAGANPGWDLVNGTGTLDITAASGSQFNILVNSLTLANVSGLATSFSDALSYNWLIADFSTVTGFAENAFNINTSSFTNSFTGTFGVSLGGAGAVPGDSSQIYLTYTAIPEPGAAFFGGLGLLALLRRRR